MVLIWITGFSGAGKTTVAKIVQEQLQAKNKNAILLDGDEVRSALGLTDNYSPEERKKIAFSYAKLGKLLADQGFYVIVATISMFEDVRQWNRRNNSHYLEVYLKVSEEERRIRDPKSLYQTGQELVEQGVLYEEPQNPDMLLEAGQKLQPEDMAAMIQQAVLDF
ncbi:adenylyl-sulfate kinase [Legionella spiritensis]|uniref:Putative adenylyl-sulfate kinase n=1 Tax=Legionella spiritensis TaxID=452 RepID=A0A0W0YYR6_LEGSP|nr:adenylyl-sulfate kinase [Legionella spiritensis]KTD62012.1 putative adenylyl-sulfate kinase [Legionella spiritensis]SNV34783.1 Bifunctional enzyme CysN/CysC [Legionella spiritensis]